ncbi:uncharacterized protein EI90DRAFT_1403439 [Cantharellus anzutake]|uniref:uncharacterized protein n=1 Tax=Cantharellus anzutake TaxID=1750568 RepID=UPI001905FF31|nr:uncharacterized protein EI90DRAFT_1403439 [Cantharellus anzutake]KAF8329476.1 hypothetical protein EI90DRAFT_1403439 [Cantharellus anzutake]
MLVSSIFEGGRRGYPFFSFALKITPRRRGANPRTLISKAPQVPDILPRKTCDGEGERCLLFLLSIQPASVLVTITSTTCTVLLPRHLSFGPGFFNVRQGTKCTARKTRHRSQMRMVRSWNFIEAPIGHDKPCSVSPVPPCAPTTLVVMSALSAANTHMD